MSLRIQPKRKLCKCGCGKEGFIWSKGMLRPCYLKAFPPKPIKKRSDKQKEKIKINGEYYSWAIAENRKKNLGTCRCDECGDEIARPTGRNVCHIVSGSADETLYHHPLNHFFLGKGLKFGECTCGDRFDNSPSADKMKIHPERLRRREQLKNKYQL